MNEVENSTNDDFLFIEMDISRPISCLKAMLSRLLSTHSITSSSPVYLKGIKLSDSSTLVNSCVVKTGQVFVKCRIKPNAEEVAIEIDDVLLAADETEEVDHGKQKVISEHDTVQCNKGSTSSAYDIGGYLWKIDSAFHEQQLARQMPFDPLQWSPADVRLWLGWARSVFRTSSSQIGADLLDDLSCVFLNGSHLCALPREKLVELVVPKRSPDLDRLSDLLQVHMTLLKQQRYVFRPWPLSRDEAAISLPVSATPFTTTPIRYNHPTYVEKNKVSKPAATGKPCLWRFILDCLTDPNNDISSVIRWSNVCQSEFVIAKPDEFAKLWYEVTGRQSTSDNKPSSDRMTSASSVARSLRMYSSEGVILSRVATAPAGCWTYRFVADLTKLIGYSAAQLLQLQQSQVN